MKNVVIIEDDIELAQYMKMIINDLKNYKCHQIFNNPLLFVKSPVKADIYLLDIIMQEMNGIQMVEKILDLYPQSHVIMNSIKDDTDIIFQALRNGASGYIDKKSFKMNFLSVFESVQSGGAYMTPKIARKVIESFNVKKKYDIQLSSREKDIVNGILDGLSYKLIADKYNISIDNVRMNVKRVYRKLNINSKGQLFKLFNTNNI
jgi:DNA-binding NarL/FixJ family response regulator